MTERVSVFGIRHHGPGSARSLLRALERLRPDVLLVEGPPDAQDLLPLAGSAAMRPPVALVIYPPEQPGIASFYPFATFSPEWNAIRYALAQDVPVRFCDLPQAVSLAARDDAPAGGAAEPDEPPDPVRWLAQAAGEDDPERWWERLVEQRRDDVDVFHAVAAAMAAVREGESDLPPREAQREAHMRQAIRQAEREGYERIAVVCGAWHAPVLESRGPARDDEQLLRGLKRIKVEATWIPWTTSRLARASGYGAGVESPAWYRHLWETDGDVAVWLATAARLLRDEDMDASPAQVVEAVRLAEALSALRGRPQPGLSEVSAATLAVLCGGEETRLRLIQRKLVVGEEMGALPEGVPSVPLQRDLEAQARRLRLKLDPEERSLDLDQRRDFNLEQSQLLHRLRILGIDWGHLRAPPPGSRGTFHELWRLKWRPELAVQVIEAGVYGNTVAAAAAARAVERGQQSADLAALAGLVELVLLAALGQAVDPLIAVLGQRSAVSTDVSQMLRALPPLAATLRYGDVRKTDTAALQAVTQAMVERAIAGLGPACAGVDEATAELLAGQIAAASRAVGSLPSALPPPIAARGSSREETAAPPLPGGEGQGEGVLADWWAALLRLADRRDLAGILAGTCCRLLLAAERISDEDATTRLGLALSRGAEPADGARWIEGFLSGAGLALATSERLFGLVDRWLVALPADHFTLVLPLLRRTTSTFAAGEKRQVAERARAGAGPAPARAGDEALDPERAALVEPVVLAILGIGR
jgi:hypothetical protein